MTALQSSSTTTNSPGIDVELSRTLASIRSAMREGGHQAALPVAVRTRLEQRRSALRAGTAPASNEQIRLEVAKLTTAFPSLRGTGAADAQAMVAQYATALQGVPLWAIREVCADIVRGAVPGLNPDFPPTAPRLRQLADERTARTATESRQIREVLDAPVVLPDDPEMAAELKKTVGEGLRNLAKQLREDDEAMRRPVLVPDGSGFKAPSGRDLAEIYRTRRLPGLPVRNGTRNDDRNGDVTVDAEYADHLRDAVGQ